MSSVSRLATVVSDVVGAAAPALDVDVAIVGGGLAGSLAALALARRGVRVAVIDRYDVYPQQFRCEKLSGPQIALLRELGALEDFLCAARPFERVLLMREGRPIGVRALAESGLSYSDMVNAARRGWPASVAFLQGRVCDIETSDGRQRVACADGRAIEARLVVLATGPADKLHARLGLRRRFLREAHSLCSGFSIAPAGGGGFPFQAMTCFGEKPGDRIGYATLFPMREAMRVNLFTYHEPRGAFAQAMSADPLGAMFAAMPSLRNALGQVRLLGPAETRAIDLYETLDPARPGLALIGDAYRSSCPATGTGVTRILTDIRQLALRHAPKWLAAPGMGAEKIAAFYADGAKMRMERDAARAAERGRALAVDTSLRWRAARRLTTMGARLRLAAGVLPGL